MVSLKSIGGELMKPGGAGRLMGQGAFWLGNQIGKAFAGDRQASTNTTPIQPTQKKQIQTYNSRYPGFDENDYLRLEQIVDGFGETGSKKAQLMDEAYQYYYPQVLNKHKLDERQEMINNRVYENGEKLANGDKLTNLQYRALNLTQMAKEKFDIAYNVNDEEILQNLKEKVPNGDELLSKFLKDGDPEILYASGIYDKGQEAQDFRSQKDIANEVLGGNFWKNAWANMYANSFAPLDAFEKFTYKGIKNLQMLGTKIDDYFADKNIPEWLRQDAFGDKTAEEIRAENQQFRDRSRNEIDDYINAVNKANQTNRERTVNPIVDNYYNRRNFTDLLAEGDIDGFFYKGLGDAASNWDMPVIIGASIVNPAMGTALMGTNSYVRESEEAYETMRKAGATHEQAEAGGAIVGMVNSAIEVYLDKMLGGTETASSRAIRDSLSKNVMDEMTKKSFGEIMEHAGKTYAQSSMEEGLEEWLQNIVTNAAEMTVKENPERKDLFEGGRAAAEGGIFNPFNILAPGGDIARNTDINSIKQGITNGTNSMIEGAKNTVNSIKNNQSNTNSEGVIDRITDWGAEKITNTVSAQDKLYKAQEPRMNILTRAKDLEKRRENSDRANELIIQNGFTPTDTTSRLQAHDATMKNVWNQVEEKINGGKEIMVDLSQISDKLDEYIEKQKRTKSTLSKADLERLKREADALRGQQITLPDAEALKQLYNATINNRGEEKVSDVLANGLKEATHEIGVIEDNLLSEIPGEFQGLKNDFGALKDTYEDVFKADMKNQRRKGAGLTETYSRIEGLGDIANGVLGVITGKGDLASIGKGAAKFLVGKSLAKSSDVDFLIEQGFKELAKQYGNNGNVTTDTVISENVNEMAGNQAQELYNQGDKNLSPNSEQMTEETTNVPTREEISDRVDEQIDRLQKIKEEQENPERNDFYDRIETPVEKATKETKKKSTKKGKKGDVKWYADEAYSPEIVMTEEEINKWEEKNGTNDTDKISLKRDLIDKLMKKGNYGEKVKVIIRKNGEMAGTHTIEKFQGDGKTYYNIDVGTPDWKVFDVKDMKNWLINNDTVYAEMGGEKYTTPEYSKWEEERNAQIEKEREESGIAEQERKISNNLQSKIGDKKTIERFKEYFKGELSKNGGKYDMYKDILAFLEGKKTVDDFVEGEIVINDFPNSVMKEIRENLGLNAISIKNLHSMIKEYGKNKNKAGNKTKQYADNSYKPSITMSEKEINSKYAGKTQIEMKNELENQMRKMEFGDRIMITDVSQGNKRTLIIEKGQRDGTDRWNLMDANGRMVDDSKYLGNITFNLRVEDLGEIYSNSEAKEKYQKEYDKARKDIEKERIERQKQKEREEKAKIREEKAKNKSQKEDVNNLISDTWSDIGDEGDWDWYKKMKKKDVITYLEDQVSGEFSDARKRGYDYGLEWSEVQKLIKKFVNQKMK